MKFYGHYNQNRPVIASKTIEIQRTKPLWLFWVPVAFCSATAFARSDERIVFGARIFHASTESGTAVNNDQFAVFDALQWSAIDVYQEKIK